MKRRLRAEHLGVAALISILVFAGAIAVFNDNGGSGCVASACRVPGLALYVAGGSLLVCMLSLILVARRNAADARARDEALKRESQGKRSGSSAQDPSDDRSCRS